MNSLTALLQAGDVESVMSLTGAPHQVSGVVEHGDHRGRTLGFPTANVGIGSEQQLPCDGVFAGWAHTGTVRTHAAAISLGRRPTFYQEQGRRLLEVHLIGFDGDLYDQQLSVDFVTLLRLQQRFDGIDELVDQLRRDVEAARDIMLVRRGGTNDERLLDTE